MNLMYLDATDGTKKGLFVTRCCSKNLTPDSVAFNFDGSRVWELTLKASNRKVLLQRHTFDASNGKFIESGFKYRSWFYDTIDNDNFKPAVIYSEKKNNRIITFTQGAANASGTI